MNKTAQYRLASLLLSVLAAPAAHAMDNKAMDMRVGTMGAGIELIKPYTADTLRFRFGLNGGDFRDHVIAHGNPYRVDAHYKSASALIDWHPNGSAFRLSSGLLYVNNRFDLSPQDGGGGITFNGTTYTAAQTGAVGGHVHYSNKLAPYLGVGYGDAIGLGKSFTFLADLGVIMQGSAHVDLTAANSAGNATMQQDMDAERHKMESDLGRYGLFPVATVGMAYQF